MKNKLENYEELLINLVQDNPKNINYLGWKYINDTVKDERLINLAKKQKEKHCKHENICANDDELPF